MTREDLVMAATDDLIAELLNRYDHAVFGAFEELPDDKTCYLSRWHGNQATCAGLASKVIESIWADRRENGYSEKTDAS